MRRLLPLALAGAFLLAACGSSSGSSSSTTQPVGKAPDRKLAQAGLLVQSDLPGYAPGNANPSEAASLATDAKKTPGCETFVANAKPDALHGWSRSYRLASTVVDGSVAVYPTEADAVAQLDAFRDPAMIGCLEALYRTALGAQVQSLSVSPVAASNVDNGFGYLVTATLVAPGGTETQLVGIQGVQQGRALASINVTGTQEQINQVSSTVLPNIQQRLKDAA